MEWLKAILGKKERDLPIAIDDGNFKQEVLDSPIPVLLDVWSDGCMPCKQLEPVILELADKYKGKVRVAELHPARAPKTIAKLGVRGTPTVIYYDRGKEVERVVGFRSSLYHSQFIEEELLSST